MDESTGTYRAILSCKVPLSIQEAHFTASKFNLSKLPSSESEENLFLLDFPINVDPKGGANPEAEMRLFQHAISTFAASDIRILQHGIQSLDHKYKSNKPKFGYNVELNEKNCSDFSWVIDSVSGAEDKLATQICRAFRCVHSAIRFLHEDTTLCSLMLVIAGECLSSLDSVIPYSEIPIDGNRAERYCRFIQSYATDEESLVVGLKDEKAKEMLKTAYFAHRSAYVHGGREVSAAVRLADSGGRAYMKHGDYGEDRRSPGNVWLLMVTRSSVLNCALSAARREDGAHAFEEIARRLARINVRTSRALKDGEVLDIFKMDVD